MNYTTTVPLRDALGDDSNVNHRTNGPIGTSTPKKNQQPQRKPTRTIAQINRTAHLEKIGAFSDPGVTKQFGRVKNTFLGELNLKLHWSEIIKMPGKKPPKMFRVITSSEERESHKMPWGAISNSEDTPIFFKVQKTGYTRIAIQFDLEQRQFKMRNCVEVVELQLLLKTLRIQVDDHVIECIPCFNYFDYSVKVTGPQNYNEIFASNILPTDIDNLPLRDELNHHERLTIHKDPSANEPLHLDVGGKIYYIELRLIKKYGYGILNKMKSYRYFSLNGEGTGFSRRYLIDRDGEIFQFVLNFLKHGQLPLPGDFQQYKMLLAEAQHYELISLVDSIMPLVTPTSWRF